MRAAVGAAIIAVWLLLMLAAAYVLAGMAYVQLSFTGVPFYQDVLFLWLAFIMLNPISWAVIGITLWRMHKGSPRRSPMRPQINAPSA